MLTAFYEVITGRVPDTLRAYLLAVLVQMVAVNLFLQFESVNVSYLEFFGVATAFGGFILGLGMVLAMGCAGAVFYRAGEGRIDYIVVIMAFALSAWASDNWLLDALRRFVGGVGVPLALPRALGMDRWVVITAIGLGAFLYLIRGRHRMLLIGWDWFKTGLVLGIVGVGAWITSSFTDSPTGLGMVKGSTNLAELVLQGDLSALNWNLAMVAAIPLGSFIAMKRHPSPARAIPFQSRRLPKTILGGMLMGIGATLAGGDNILHGLSGVPILGLSSIVVMLFIFAGAWIGIRSGWLN